jgi:hypothetical protein
MNKFINICFLVIFVFVFNGCQNNLKIFDNSSIYKKGLMHTKVKSLVYEKETKAIINITYLNATDTKKYNNNFQNFLVGVYITNGNKNFTITMNGKNYIQTKTIDKNTQQYKQIPLKNQWAKYYILSFETSNEKILKIQYQQENLQKITLQFQKE